MNFGMSYMHNLSKRSWTSLDYCRDPNPTLGYVPVRNMCRNVSILEHIFTPFQTAGYRLISPVSPIVACTKLATTLPVQNVFYRPVMILLNVLGIEP